MMAYQKMAEFIWGLIHGTEQGKLLWDETEKEDVYQLAFPEYTVRVYEDYPEGGDYPIIFLSIHNDKGVQIERVSESGFSEYEHGASWLPNLYEAARRRAMGVEDALDKLLASLPKDEEIVAESDFTATEDDIPF